MVVVVVRGTCSSRKFSIENRALENGGDKTMNSKTTGFLARALMFVMVAFLAAPAAVFAQSRTNGVYVYGQDNGRWNQDRRRDERRRDRRDDRWDRRNGRTDDGYGNYGGSFNLRQTALNAGFADGVKEGRKDRSKNERFEFRDEGNFQSATRDFSSRLGDRELYRTYYRQAFENGYRDGYAGY
jgi:hypothetical protein